MDPTQSFAQGLRPNDHNLVLELDFEKPVAIILSHLKKETCKLEVQSMTTKNLRKSHILTLISRLWRKTNSVVLLETR
jgi:hypothetical protein